MTASGANALDGLAIADSVLDLVGQTPLVRLSRVTEGIATPVVAKLETTNPGGSVKDRAAVAMIDAAEAEGLLQPDGIIVEPTSGNTGVGLAVVAAQRGYRCIFVCTDKVAPEKVALLRAYGAEVVVCPNAVQPEDPRSYYSTAERLRTETPGAFSPNQYANPHNPLAHYESTGPEVWSQTAGRVTHFVAGAGTGGTVSGVGRYLKEQNPDVQVVIADPPESVYAGGDGRPYLVEGIGEDFWPATFDPGVVDRVIPVTDAESFAVARRVTQTEGLLIGGSGGTAVAGALTVARELDAAGRAAESLVVTLIPDSGRGYLSRVFDNEWMAQMGFETDRTFDGATVADLVDGEFVYVRPDDSVAVARQCMDQAGLRAVPVCTGDMPIAAAQVIGSVAQDGLLAFGDEVKVADAVEALLPAVGVGEPAGRVAELLRDDGTLGAPPAVVVYDEGRPVATLGPAASQGGVGC